MPATQRKHLSLAYSVLSPHTESDRRAHERLTVSALSWLDSVRLKYGPAVSLIDLSAGGAQIETVSHRLQPGSTVAIEIAGRSGDLVIPSRVIRCHVTALAPHATYRGALEFKRLITLPSSDPVPSINEDVNPVREHARLMVALRRVTGSSSGDGSPVALSTEVGVASLAGAMALIESPAGRRAGTAFARDLSRLFRAITAALESGQYDASRLLEELTERLRRAVP